MSPISNKILLCFAVKQEARFCVDWPATKQGLRILLTGMGGGNARKTVRAALTRARPKLVLSCGFAGGLNPKLPHGAVLFQTEGLHELDEALEEAGAQRAKFVSQERVVITAEEKRALWQKTGADAVEMESDAIWAICRQLTIPCATVRVILDPARKSLPFDFNQIMTEDKRLDGFKLALGILKSPVAIPGLLLLQSQSRRAARRLARVLEAGLSAFAVRNL
ncbi:MAG TPA: hypothetical protein VG146_09030 [Verrucomicrobiae bacterium]|nr:hypothetical protein [Verrucomicrobiae bacterium]